MQLHRYESKHYDEANQEMIRIENDSRLEEIHLIKG